MTTREMVDSWVNGNRKDVVSEILTRRAFVGTALFEVMTLMVSKGMPRDACLLAEQVVDKLVDAQLDCAGGGDGVGGHEVQG